MAARFWIGGGTNTNWDASPTTNWAATSGGVVRVAAPTSADDVTFDGAGNTASVLATGVTILSLTFTTGYTSSVTLNATLVLGAGSFTDRTNHTWAGSFGLQFSTSCTITSNGATFPNPVLCSAGGSTLTINGLWTVTNTITLAGATGITFAGTDGFTCSTLLLNPSSGGFSYTFVNTVTYTITTAFTANTTRTGSIITLISNHATNKAIITLNNGATCNVEANFTRIDASNGRAIYSFGGTITTCNNIFRMDDNLTPAQVKIVKAGRFY